ncbi:MAG: hypothetical protein V8R80_05245 [Eubacterium sp.]
MIEISHLTKKYGAHVAVNDLSLTIEPGNIYGFLAKRSREIYDHEYHNRIHWCHFR